LKYRNMSSALRADTRSAVIRIGQLKVGLAIAGELELIQEAAGPTRLKDYRAGAKKKVGHVNSQLGLAREVLHMLEIAQDARSLSTTTT